MQSYKMCKARKKARTVPKMAGMNALPGQDDPDLVMLDRGSIGPQMSSFTMA